MISLLPTFIQIGGLITFEVANPQFMSQHVKIHVKKFSQYSRMEQNKKPYPNAHFSSRKIILPVAFDRSN